MTDTIVRASRRSFSKVKSALFTLAMKTRVLGASAVARPEHVVARLEPRDAPADRFDAAGDVDAGTRRLRPAQPSGRQAHERRLAAHHAPVERVEPGRVDFDRHFVVFGDGLGRFDETQDIGGASVFRVDDCLHCADNGLVTNNA